MPGRREGDPEPDEIPEVYRQPRLGPAIVDAFGDLRQRALRPRAKTTAEVSAELNGRPAYARHDYDDLREPHRRRRAVRSRHRNWQVPGLHLRKPAAQPGELRHPG